MKSTALALVMGALLGCSVPPTRRSHTVYADEAKVNIEDGSWALSFARCAFVDADLVAQGLGGTLEIELTGVGYVFRLSREGGDDAGELRVELVRASCPRCVELYVATLAIPEGSCRGSCVRQGLARVAREPRALVWTQSLPSLCHGDPVTLRFSPGSRPN